jgi:hypothetical protein
MQSVKASVPFGVPFSSSTDLFSVQLL